MRANWKLLIENGVDGYHSAPTHQTYFEMISNLNDDSAQALSYSGGDNISESDDLGGGHAFMTIKTMGFPIADADLRNVVAEQRAGIAFFCAVVVVTMLSALSFDPRLIWDRHP